MPSLIVASGQHYNRLTVIQRVANRRPGRPVFECLCLCGNKCRVESMSLLSGNTKSCGCLGKEAIAVCAQRYWMLPRGEAAVRALYKRYVTEAKTRSLSFSLEMSDFKQITKRNCYYCGVPPKQATVYSGTNGQWTYNGLDRVVNSEGYCLDNVVPCCKRCNWAKSSMTQREFISHIKRIAANINRLKFENI